MTNTYTPPTQQSPKAARQMDVQVDFPRGFKGRNRSGHPRELLGARGESRHSAPNQRWIHRGPEGHKAFPPSRAQRPEKRGTACALPLSSAPAELCDPGQVIRCLWESFSSS